MTTDELTLKRRLKHCLHAVKNKMGLPVNYTSLEAKQFKLRIDPAHLPETRTSGLAQLFAATREEVGRYITEAQQLPLIKQRDEIEQTLDVGSPMSTDDSITLYAAVRLSKPQVAVETGTAAGASAAYILEAMHRNGFGQLHSIDRIQNSKTTGVLIRDELRAKVQLHTGDCLEVLPALLERLGSIDFFLHDSNHEYKHMTAEYRLGHGAISPGGVIASHDILHCNAWRHFLKRHRIARSAAVRNFGVCVVG